MTRILSRRRRISVRAEVEKIGNKYRSAGRLPIGSPGSGEYLFGLQRSTPLRHFVALFPSRGRKTLRDWPLCHQWYMSESQSLLLLEEGVAAGDG